MFPNNVYKNKYKLVLRMKFNSIVNNKSTRDIATAFHNKHHTTMFIRFAKHIFPSIKLIQQAIKNMMYFEIEQNMHHRDVIKTTPKTH